MSSRWVCAACGGWCEVLTEEDSEPKTCPYNRSGDYPEWERIDEDEEEQEEK